MQDGTQNLPQKGTPQGGVASPLLANLFLHYAFDQWMERKHPGITLERYANDGMCHGKSQTQVEKLKQDLDARLKDVGLKLHPEKTTIVYCRDDYRQEDYPCTSFVFLGYSFRPRQPKNRWGQDFINFTPAISNKGTKAIRQTSRQWESLTLFTR